MLEAGGSLVLSLLSFAEGDAVGAVAVSVLRVWSDSVRFLLVEISFLLLFLPLGW